MRVIFAGVSDFSAAVFQALIESDHFICALITQPDKPSSRGKKIIFSPCKNIAQNEQIPVLQPENINHKVSIEQIKSYNADMMIVASYGQMIGSELLNFFRYGVLNTHASLLPKFRGASPIQSVILANEKETGISMMKMRRSLDSGPVGLIEKIKLEKHETSESLEKKLKKIAALTTLDAIEKIENHTIKFIEQNHQNKSYCSKIKKEDARLNFRDDIELIDRKIRAFFPNPIAYCDLNYSNQSIRLKIHQAKIQKNNAIVSLIQTQNISNFETGKLIYSKKQLFVVCKKANGERGFLEIQKIQLEGKKPIFARDFIGSTLQNLKNQNPAKLNQPFDFYLS